MVQNGKEARRLRGSEAQKCRVKWRHGMMVKYVASSFTTQASPFTNFPIPQNQTQLRTPKAQYH
jgi:hypothetical protein